MAGRDQQEDDNPSLWPLEMKREIIYNIWHLHLSFIKDHVSVMNLINASFLWLTWGITGLFCSAVHLEIAIPMPSIKASKPPPTTAEIVAAFAPPRAASTPPVKAPDMIEFQGSSFCRIPFNPQSKVEKRPPQTAKLPPNTGARAFIADTAPVRRSP